MEPVLIICSDCGMEIDPSKQFCEFCGEEIPVDYDVDSIITPQINYYKDSFPIWYYIIGLLFPYIGIFIWFINYKTRPESSKNLIMLIIGGAIIYGLLILLN